MWYYNSVVNNKHIEEEKYIWKNQHVHTQSQRKHSTK